MKTKEINYYIQTNTCLNTSSTISELIVKKLTFTAFTAFTTIKRSVKKKLETGKKTLSKLNTVKLVFLVNSIS